MIQIDQELVRQLRVQAIQGASPTNLLRSILGTLSENDPAGAVLVLYMMEAFGLEQYQLNCIFGWAPDGPRELSDEQLDELLQRRMSGQARQDTLSKVASSS